MSDNDYIKQLREHLKPKVDELVPTFEGIDKLIISEKAYIEKEVETFAQTDHVAYKVGERMSEALRPVVKLQIVRRAIYDNAKIVSHFRTFTFQKLYEAQADAKSLHSLLWTELMGDEVMMDTIKSNSGRESEVGYIMLPIRKLSDSIKAKYTVARNRLEWIMENLDQLNKIESALRLEHNMKLTLNDVASSGNDDSLGDTEGVGLTESDLGTVEPGDSRFSKKKQDTNLGQDPLDDMGENSIPEPEELG